MCQLWNSLKKWSPATLDLQNLKGRLWPCLKIWCFAFIAIFTFSRKRDGSGFQHLEITYWCNRLMELQAESGWSVDPSGCRAFRRVWVHRSRRHTLSCLPRTPFLASLLLYAHALPLKKKRWGENSLCCIPLLHWVRNYVDWSLIPSQSYRAREGMEYSIQPEHRASISQFMCWLS